MILIGERINAGFKDIKEAIPNKDGDVIKEWAVKQTKAGASYIDVNLGTVSNKPEDLCWMIEQVQEAVDTPISIDNNKPSMLKEAVPVCKKPPLINSTTAVEEKMNDLFPIVAKHGASIIGLVMDEAASEILKAASQFQLFSDPPCHIVCGLSNISNGTKYKKLINRTFLVMLIANGCDAAICDVMDDNLVDAVLTAELAMNRQIFADSYIEAFRKK